METTVLEHPAPVVQQQPAPEQPAPATPAGLTLDLSQVAADFVTLGEAKKKFTDASAEYQAALKLPTQSALDAARDLRVYAASNGLSLLVGDLRAGNGKGKGKGKGKADAATAVFINAPIRAMLIEAGMNEGTASQVSKFIGWVANDPARENLARDGKACLGWKKAYTAVEIAATGKLPEARTVLRARVNAALAMLDEDTVKAIVASKLTAADISDALIREADDKVNGEGVYADAE